jgi:hypothetical protein
MENLIRESEIKRRNNLVEQIEKVKCFKVGGLFFIGKYKEAVEKFIENNPEPADFFVWLQNNWKQLK